MNTQIDQSRNRRAGSVRTLFAWQSAGTVRSTAATLSLSIVLGCGGAIAAGQSTSEPEPPDPERAALLRQPPAALRQIYRVCARDAVAGRLGSAETTACSIAYDVLLKHHFRGDFAALLNWSAAARDEPVACADTNCGVSGSDERPAAQGVD